MAEFQVVSSPVLNIFLSSSTSSFLIEKRFNKDLTVSALKGKLELLTGAVASSQQLEVYDTSNKAVCKLDNDDALLGSYPIDDGMRIHVIDLHGTKGQFDDTSKVEKYEMKIEDYEKRTDSVRAFKERNKIGRFNPEEQAKHEEEKKKKQEAEAEQAAKITIGNRCEVRIPAQPTKRGEVMFVGETEFKPGLWVGVKYDEPLGKNDGSVAGKRYFECQQKYGAFVKPMNVEVGDFPEEDFDIDDEMEM